MNFLVLILHLVFFLCFCASNAQYYNKLKYYDLQEEIAKTITVDLSGQGDFKSVQQAIDSVPSNNNVWTRIHVNAGTYIEKVQIPPDKPKILLDGENTETTMIQWDEGGGSLESATFTLKAEDFVARNLTFKNTYNHILPEDVNGHPVGWAPAALINADKAAFYGCGFVSLQDTLTDSIGRHYFESCYIEGAIDFIWGDGQSIYQGCTLNVTASLLGGQTTTITAQARNSSESSTGFVFISCSVIGTGPTLLGRAYRQYSRVLFYKTNLSNIIAPEGWSSWHYGGQEDSISYSEVDCNGPGADQSGRVKWEKKLSPEDLSFLTNVNTFINEGGWIENQPKIQ